MNVNSKLKEAYDFFFFTLVFLGFSSWTLSKWNVNEDWSEQDWPSSSRSLVHRLSMMDLTQMQVRQCRFDWAFSHSIRYSRSWATIDVEDRLQEAQDRLQVPQGLILILTYCQGQGSGQAQIMIKKMGEERTRRGEVGSGQKFTKCRVFYVLWHVIMMIMEEYMICVKRKILLNWLCIEEMDFQSKSLCLWLPPGHAPSIPVGSPFLFALQQLLVL